ncbi:MAG: AtpZ/AtpI family protein [Acidobacteria bacterium]|nr:AtpZ/AtpI family protein [Acidobacteriota bacterium]
MNNRKLALAVSVSSNLAAPIIGGILLGYFLDQWLNTKPWLILLGTLLGTTGAFLALYRIVNKMNQETDEE